MIPVYHGQFTLDRTYPQPPARVFRAWSDPASKAAWFHGPAEWDSEPGTLDFREGGRERLRGGPRGGPLHTMDARYHDIVPNQRIVYTYDLYLGESRMSVSLVTVTFRPLGSGTRLSFTEQVVFVDGHDGVASREEGTSGLLGALGQHLDAQGAQEQHNTRLFDATPEQIYAAWTDPARLARWWGPAGFTNTIQTLDHRPGGDWVLVMHAPDGAEYLNHWIFQEIEPARRVTLEHQGGHHFTLEASFDPEGEQTRMTWVARFDDPEICAQLRPVIAPSNEQNFDRLAAELRR